MPENELEQQLEQFLRKRDKDFVDHRKKHHQEQDSLTDEDWWAQLIERTQAIRPQMLPIFERNKSEMIAGRHKTAKQESEYREKQLRKKVLELLPLIYIVREDLGATGPLDEMQVEAAMLRLDIELGKLVKPTFDLTNLN